MPDGGEALTLRVIDGIGRVPAAEWDACNADDNPFTCHAFLAALEESGSATGETGWLPQHLVAEDPAGRLLGVVPMYLKSHSHGEYVFDWGWADAYERAGGRYYPKLQVSVPFAPVTGRRLLVRPGDGRDIEGALAAGMAEVARRSGISSVHVTFPTEAEWRRLGADGWLQRLGEQFHWRNHGYGCFDDFLAALASRKRKAIRRERRKVAESGIRVHALTGDDLRPAHWDAFHGFYLATSDKKWGYPYLTRDFFHLLGETLADKVVLVMAEAEGQFVAGAFNMLGPDALYGRNWGALGEFRFLHFEACYYQAIEFAISRGLARVEAGAQGPHKIQRGYVPVATYSAHWIGDERLRAAVDDFLARERRAVEAEIDYLAGHAPFRRGGQGGDGNDDEGGDGNGGGPAPA